jgi:hypothetical protein
LEGTEANDRVRVLFGTGGEDGTEGQVIDRLGEGGGELLGIMGREAQDAGGSEEAAGVAGRQIELAEVQAGIEEQGDIGTVVDDERNAGGAAMGGHELGLLEDGAGVMALVAELEDARAALEQGQSGGLGRAAAAG